MSDQKPVHDGKIAANFIREFQKNFSLVLKLYQNRRVPLWVKIIPFIGVLYWLNPIDPLPPPFNLTPIDDFAVLLLGIKLLIELSPRDLVDDLRFEINYGASNNDGNGEVIDTTYEVLDDE